MVTEPAILNGCKMRSVTFEEEYQLHKSMETKMWEEHVARTDKISGQFSVMRMLWWAGYIPLITENRCAYIILVEIPVGQLRIWEDNWEILER